MSYKTRGLPNWGVNLQTRKVTAKKLLRLLATASDPDLISLREQLEIKLGGGSEAPLPDPVQHS